MPNAAKVVGPKTLVSLVAVVVVVFAVTAALFLLPMLATNTTTTHTKPPLEFVSTHLDTFGRRDVALILNNYAGDAEVVWSGESGGLAGRYRGVSAIRAFLTTVLTNSDKVELKAADTSGRVLEDGTAHITSKITLQGHNAIIGEFDGEAQATYILVQTPQGWRIKLESWDFKKFNAEGPGATAFPQWTAFYGKRATPSADFVKDLFWNLGEASPFIIALTAAGFLTYVFASRKTS